MSGDPFVLSPPPGLSPYGEEAGGDDLARPRQPPWPHLASFWPRSPALRLRLCHISVREKRYAMIVGRLT